MAEFESIYFYDPSLAASILFTILYFVPTAFIFYEGVIPRSDRYRHVGFFIPLFIAGAAEVAGYALRCASVKLPTDIPLYATSSSLVVIAPVFVCASLYLLIGRLVRAVIPTQGKQQNILGISPRWLPRAFITSDICSFLTQASGSGVAASGDWEGTSKEIGTNILIAGLALQLLTFSVFMTIVIIFHRRANRLGTGVDDGVRQLLKGIYIAGVFILLRCIYRLIEFALGIDGYPFRSEWMLYVLEASPMLFALGALAFYHPGKWLPTDAKPEAINSA
ncbi:hypothetical protein AJ80_01643 [Polytolypa hystricis UAMH7299]|uniref:RTA1 domain-containing protein n=1 Tax=Polytolypa hystricis (strain UAMH7299) TaxID=1447883 RepID=A0A2B7Z1I8_POLH7|nr:hypothetical protein AJ80_01643 [Polytolypa hystricis UAMH7299]